MKMEKIDLYEYFGIQKQDGASGYLNCFIREKSPHYSINRGRPAMLVLPGGGYHMRSDRENEPIVIEFLANGFNAFSLEYSVGKFLHPTQLIEGAMAIAYIRENALELGVNKDNIGAIGFSAGGHLAGMLGTMFDDEEVKLALGEKAKNARPNAVILSYPVASAFEHAEKGSIENICGTSTELRKKVDIPNRVNEKSSPAFIWATADDEIVDSENSLLLGCAYKKACVPFALHIFESGEHGLALANREVNTPSSDVRAWVKMCFSWLEQRGFAIID